MNTFGLNTIAGNEATDEVVLHPNARKEKKDEFQMSNVQPF